MADSTLDLIQKLIRLATSNANEPEALRAALKACQLIVREKVVLSIKGQSVHWETSRRAQPVPTPSRSQYDFWGRSQNPFTGSPPYDPDFAEEMIRQQREAYEEMLRQARERERDREQRQKGPPPSPMTHEEVLQKWEKILKGRQPSQAEIEQIMQEVHRANEAEAEQRRHGPYRRRRGAWDWTG